MLRLKGKLGTLFSAPMIGIFLALVFAAGAQSQTTSTASGAAATNSINSQCAAMQNAFKTTTPIHMGLRSTRWVVLSDQDAAAVDRTHIVKAVADVWKRGDNVAWVQTHSWNTEWSRRANQLCFRPSAGTLARAQQSSSIKDINAQNAQRAYFSPNGTLIGKTDGFVVDDPMVVKKVSELPFYSVLPK